MMARYHAIGLALFIVAGSLAAVPVRADDIDGDGVPDSVDWCNNTPPGTAVDIQGRPLGDVDKDCDTDLADFALFGQGFTGSLDQTGAMVLIPGGSFQMGDPWSEGDTDELPVHTVYVSPYHLDTYEVTNQQYVDALNWACAQGGLITVTGGVVYKYNSGTAYPYCCTTSAPTGPPHYGEYSRIAWNGSTFGVVPEKGSHPMVMVSWYGAVAFANWRSAMQGKPLCYDLSTWDCSFGVAGYRLPTEAEWEKAAGWDPAQSRHYRFGEHTDGSGYNGLDGQRANYSGSGDPFETGAYPWTTPVGYYDGTTHGSYTTQSAQSYYGCYDMSGNVLEWCNDWYSSPYYSSSPGSNPTGPASGTGRVLRGGGWGLNPASCRSAFRFDSTPDHRGLYTGFRCGVGTP